MKKQTHAKGPWNKGTAKGFIDQRGYRCFKIGNKTIREHRIIMEKHLGRKLEPWEHVHHIDGNKTNNKIENLQLVDVLQRIDVLQLIDAAAHNKEHHQGSKRSGQAKLTMALVHTVRMEIVELRKTEMLEALRKIRNTLEVCIKIINKSPVFDELSDLILSIDHQIEEVGDS